MTSPIPRVYARTVRANAESARTKNATARTKTPASISRMRSQPGLLSSINLGVLPDVGRSVFSSFPLSCNRTRGIRLRKDESGRQLGQWRQGEHQESCPHVQLAHGRWTQPAF